MEERKQLRKTNDSKKEIMKIERLKERKKERQTETKRDRK